MILIQATTDIYSKDLTIKQGLIEQNTGCGLKAAKAVEVPPLVTP